VKLNEEKLPNYETAKRSELDYKWPCLQKESFAAGRRMAAVSYLALYNRRARQAQARRDVNLRGFRFAQRFRRAASAQ
jgi:hypothetical protein